MDLLFPKIWAPKSADQDSSRRDSERKDTVDVQNSQLDSDVSDGESFTSDAQDGVKNVEAMTSVWSRSNLIMAYVFIFIIYFVSSMQQNMTWGLSPYVTSAFQAHSLTAATSIMSSIIGGITKLPLAKILDIWGRPQGFAIMVLCLTIGLIMMAACNDVRTYSAAQVFYWVGYATLKDLKIMPLDDTD